mgnify:CR=1 FL=1
MTSAPEQLFTNCSRCGICAGSRLQAPPMLYLGDINAPILVIAQNPGWIADNDSFRLASGRAMLKLSGLEGDDAIIGAAQKAWYEADFTTSHAYGAIESICGKDWLNSGRYLYTNAVRCRTNGNETSSKEMKTSCATWTRMLLDRPSVKGVIFIGRLAVEQVLGNDADKLQPMALKKQTKTGLLLLAIPHYSRWTGTDEGEATMMVKRLVEAI